MPDKRHHRGPHPEDAELFAPAQWPRLRTAVAELSWLLSRDYAKPSALKVVGDRHDLNQRQRVAVMRSACSDAARDARKSRELPPDAVAGRVVALDGYNVLTTVEAALAGAVVLGGRDGCYRDIASLHGTWRKVEETAPAARLVGGVLRALGVGPVLWLLDSPVSNSGRLKATLAEVAAAEGWAWQIELVPDPDRVLVAAAEVMVTADSVVLDRGGTWFNLAREVVRREVAGAYVVDLGA